MRRFAVIALMALIPAFCHAAPVTPDPDMKACKELEGDKAIAACDRVLQSKPLPKDREIEARDMLGVNQTNTARFDDAITNLTRVIALDSKNSGAYSGRGVAYADKKDFDKAFADFSAALKLNPSNASAYADRCQVYALQKKYELALADCDRLVSLKPAVALAWAERGRVHFLNHDLASAIADLNQAVHLDPKNPHFYSLRAAAYSEERNNAQAVKDDLVAAEMAPDDWTILNRLSLHLLFAHRDDGLEIFDGLVHRHPQSAAPYYFRGEAYEQREKLKEAISDLDTFIRLRPEDAKGFRLRGIYLEKAGVYDRASADFGEAIKREKDQNLLSADYESRCVSRAEMGEELDAGIADCNRALQMNDGRWDAYTGRAFAEFRQKKYAAALADFEKDVDVQTEPKDLTEAVELSVANLLTGRSINALPPYPPGSVLTTDLATAYCGRALTKARMEDAKGANDDLAAAEKLDAASVVKCKRLYGATH